MRSNYPGIVFGAGLGAAVAMALGHMGIWLGAGIAIGTVIGGLLGRNQYAKSHKQHQSGR